MKEKIWAYYIPITAHDHNDGNGKRRWWYLNEDYKETNDIDYSVWDELVASAAEKRFNTLLVSIGDGIKYESHPEISSPDAVSKEFLKKKLDEARALGLTPVPKLNFSTEHHAWLKDYRRMVSSKPYRQMTVDLIDEVCELFDNPKYFHLGMDEETSLDCEQWREAAIMRGENLMFEDFGIMFDACRKNGARPWVWSDYRWINPEIFERRMPRDVVQSNWFYSHFAEYPQGHFYNDAISSYEVLEKLGFDQIPTASTYDCNENPYETFAHIKKTVSDEHLLGFNDAPWYYLFKENIFLHRNNLDAWDRGRKKAEKEGLL